MEADTDVDILDLPNSSYRLLQELVAGDTFLCSDVAENIVVLKRLEDDCLHANQLHPSIKDRLARVRELAHPRIATLRTVERWRGVPYLVWTYLDGESWEDAIKIPGQNLAKLSSALAATVDGLHETGIVHGSLHGRNITIRPDKQVWLTHLSPYLYTDPAVDITAVEHLLRTISPRLPEPLSNRFNLLVNELSQGQLGLREFSHLVLTVPQDKGEAPHPPVEQPPAYRLRSLLLAGVLSVIAFAVWVVLNRLESKPADRPTTFPSLMQMGR